MKKSFIVGLLSLSLLSATAQDLPKPSPLCTYSQVVGLTHVSLEYSRPSVKEREIFGSLVPFDQVWRLGANAPTMLTVDTEIIFEDQIVKPGKYSVFATPSKDHWKIEINTPIDSWSVDNYKTSKNVATIKVKPESNSHTESLSITVEDITANDGNIVIAWAKTKVVVPFKLNTDKTAVENIEAAIKKGENLDQVYSKAGAYYREGNDLKRALKFAEKSIDIKEGYANLFLKARILAETGNKKEAIKLAENALTLANKAKSTGYAKFIEGTLEGWKK